MNWQKEWKAITRNRDNCSNKVKTNMEVTEVVLFIIIIIIIIITLHENEANKAVRCNIFYLLQQVHCFD
jgi:hypothetical protein